MACICGYTGDSLWEPANNGTGPRNWFVVRHVNGGPTGHNEYHYDSHGNLIRYTMGGAHRNAKEMNTNG